MPLITFEGGDGAGKTTQIKRVADSLRNSQGLNVLTTLEPGGTELGSMVRSIFLNPDIQTTNIAEIMLLMAARSQHCHQVLFPALLTGRMILCDRFTDSTKAYQAYGQLGIIDGKLSELLQQIDYLNRIATTGITPSLTLWLDVDPETAIKRTEHRGSKDRIESKPIDFHHRVRSGYQQMTDLEPRRFVRIDANLEPELVTAQILDTISKLISFN